MELDMAKIEKATIDALLREGSRSFREGNFAKATKLYGIVVDATGDRIINRWRREAQQKLDEQRNSK